MHKLNNATSRRNCNTSGMSAAVNMVYKTQDNVRMAGFLEKKGKMKLMSQWKKYWFVLEERLLLYYRSEVEYTNLSPCRGSLNMGLVTTVRPGASSGPCIIHVITRTQVVQLRAKNRAIQEEWLEALLHSMSLPLVPKTLKPHLTKKRVLGCGLSLENIACKHQENGKNYDNEWTYLRKLDYGKRQISGSVHGGSLDTAIWSKKLKPPRTPSPSISKGKVLEKVLGFAAENDFVNTNAFPENSRLSLNDDKETKCIGENDEKDEFWEKEWNVKCKVHDENRNHELYSKIEKRTKKVVKTLSDTELNRKSVESEKKEESSLYRLRNVLSKIPRDKILKVRSEAEKRSRPTKKRRQSFLQKVFKRKDEIHDCESDVSDPLYDTIGHREEPNSFVPVPITQDDALIGGENEKCNEIPNSVESLYAEIKKPVVGSKIILPARALSELKLKLKSRENLEEGLKTSESAPSLPPRRMSRPISPWHDVPTNNAPVGDGALFFVHQAMVRFNDRIPPIDLPKTENEFSDIEDLKLDLIAEPPETSTLEKKKNDDLSILLDQLTKITVAPLAEPELTDDTYNSSSDSEKFWNKSQFSDPDYDIPRPHKPLNILISQEREIISSTQFMGRCDSNSDTGSLRSVEPDSLEMVGKKTNAF